MWPPSLPDSTKTNPPEIKDMYYYINIMNIVITLIWIGFFVLLRRVKHGQTIQDAVFNADNTQTDTNCEYTIRFDIPVCGIFRMTRQIGSGHLLQSSCLKHFRLSISQWHLIIETITPRTAVLLTKYILYVSYFPVYRMDCRHAKGKIKRNACISYCQYSKSL